MSLHYRRQVSLAVLAYLDAHATEYVSLSDIQNQTGYPGDAVYHSLRSLLMEKIITYGSKGYGSIRRDRALRESPEQQARLVRFENMCAKISPVLKDAGWKIEVEWSDERFRFLAYTYARTIQADDLMDIMVEVITHQNQRNDAAE